MCRVDDESIWAYICIYAYKYILIRTCVWIHCIWIYTWCQWIVMYLCSTKSRSLEIHKVVRAEVNSRSSSPGVYQFNDDKVWSLPDDPRSVPSRMGRDHRWSTDPQWLFSWDPWLYKQKIKLQNFSNLEPSKNSPLMITINLGILSAWQSLECLDCSDPRCERCSLGSVLAKILPQHLQDQCRTAIVCYSPSQK